MWGLRPPVRMAPRKLMWTALGIGGCPLPDAGTCRMRILGSPMLVYSGQLLVGTVGHYIVWLWAGRHRFDWNMPTGATRMVMQPHLQAMSHLLELDPTK